jgi:hypothetical protein
MRCALLVAWLVVAGAPQAGCLAVAAGAAAGYGAYEYADGVYTASVPATVDGAWRATIAALEQEHAVIKARTRERTGGQVRAVASDQTSIEIELARNPSGDFTRVSIRFGVFGDESRSRAMAARIKENL